MVRNMLILCFLILIGALFLFLLALLLGLPGDVLLLAKGGILIGGICSLAVAISLWLFGKDRTKVLLTNAIVLLTTLLFLTIFCEFALRVVFKNITSTGDNASYFARNWNKKNVQLNSFGYREIEFDIDKPDGAYRIAVVGDSFTFGQGIKEEERFSNLLRKHLNSKGQYQVFNFGKPGYDTIDNLQVLRDVVLKTKPDFVILQWYINDFEGRRKRYRPKTMRLLPSDRVCSILHRYSVLYYLINLNWQSLQTAFGYVLPYREVLHQKFSNPMSPDSVEAEQALRDFIDECEDQGITIGIVLFPNFEDDLGASYSYGYLHKRVLELCHKMEITCLDLRTTFARYPKKQLWVNRFDTHPNALANRIATDHIIETFAPLWLSGNDEHSIGKGLILLGTRW